MDKTDARYLPLAVCNWCRRRAVKLPERGMTMRELAAPGSAVGAGGDGGVQEGLPGVRRHAARGNSRRR